ncbi:hypothetical protein PUNSTDRAFT_97504 [Punctularia strigosozonata HHB-11173 SS5]|uniref:uncharacterized protein n=1 Tax=Punctularia strigosozonata (strain HHB-11173) TaxID=741275 RepID=UPI0004416C32|nr:uncharacterized protein PUNSTDRAFT_97504 [Punctularia strigosozonata HHB-11173 SS5]EIN12689.1 hypothetical protein PUNSTDRAFT_97504 [Punctularia strigosozonata HHB-11173 SS5]
MSSLTPDADSPWDDDDLSTARPSESAVADADWARLESNFVNAGYREGITAGKESALQEGFDAGFAQVGVPLGRQVGLLRGRAAALLSFLSVSGTSDSEHLHAARDIANKLGSIRFSDIAPRDLEAEQHAKEHLDSYKGSADADTDLGENEELADKRAMEGLEDLMANMSSARPAASSGRPSLEDLPQLEKQLDDLCLHLGIPPRS